MAADHARLPHRVIQLLTEAKTLCTPRMTLTLSAGLDIHLCHKRLIYKECASRCLVCTSFLPEADPPVLPWEPAVSRETAQLNEGRGAAGGVPLRGRIVHGDYTKEFESHVGWRTFYTPNDRNGSLRLFAFVPLQTEEGDALDASNTGFHLLFDLVPGGLKLIQVHLTLDYLTSPLARS